MERWPKQILEKLNEWKSLGSVVVKAVECIALALSVYQGTLGQSHGKIAIPYRAGIPKPG